MADPRPRRVSPERVAEDEPGGAGSPGRAAPPRGRSSLRWAIALAVGVVLLGFALGMARVASLQGEVRRLEAQVEGLEGQLGAARSALADYRSRFGQVRTRVSELQERIASLGELVGSQPAGIEGSEAPAPELP